MSTQHILHNNSTLLSKDSHVNTQTEKRQVDLPLEKYLQRMVLSFALEAAVVEVMLAVVGGVDLMAAEGVCWGAALHLLGTHCDSHCDVLRSCLLMHLQDKTTVRHQILSSKCL